MQKKIPAVLLFSAVMLPCAYLQAAEIDSEELVTNWGTLETYCMDCHNFQDYSGGIDFTLFDPEDVAEEATVNFREDVLKRVMAGHEIDESNYDAFVVFAADYDHDDNGYLKKAELEDAAQAWNAAHNETEESPEEAVEEAAPDAEASEQKVCGICGTVNAADATVCSACSFDFEA